MQRHADVFGDEISGHLLAKTGFGALDGGEDAVQQRLMPLGGEQREVADVVFVDKRIDFVEY